MKMGTRLTARGGWGVIVILVVAGALSACGRAHRSSVPASGIVSPSVSSLSPTVNPLVTQELITQVVLERVPGGPSYEWQHEHIVLRRPADGAPAAAAFGHLSHFLEKSGFFTRKSGYVDPYSLFPSDVGHLMIKVTRGSQTFQVWSYNGLRDKELSATENAVRRAARLMQPPDAKRHHESHSRDGH